MNYQEAYQNAANANQGRHDQAMQLLQSGKNIDEVMRIVGRPFYIDDFLDKNPIEGEISN